MTSRAKNAALDQEQYSQAWLQQAKQPSGKVHQAAHSGQQIVIHDLDAQAASAARAGQIAQQKDHHAPSGSLANAARAGQGEQAKDHCELADSLASSKPPDRDQPGKDMHSMLGDTQECQQDTQMACMSKAETGTRRAPEGKKRHQRLGRDPCGQSGMQQVPAAVGQGATSPVMQTAERQEHPQNASATGLQQAQCPGQQAQMRAQRLDNDIGGPLQTSSAVPRGQNSGSPALQQAGHAHPLQAAGTAEPKQVHRRTEQHFLTSAQQAQGDLVNPQQSGAPRTVNSGTAHSRQRKSAQLLKSAVAPQQMQQCARQQAPGSMQQKKGTADRSGRTDVTEREGQKAASSGLDPDAFAPCSLPNSNPFLSTGKAAEDTAVKSLTGGDLIAFIDSVNAASADGGSASASMVQKEGKSAKPRHAAPLTHGIERSSAAGTDQSDRTRSSSAHMPDAAQSRSQQASVKMPCAQQPGKGNKRSGFTEGNRTVSCNAPTEAAAAAAVHDYLKQQGGKQPMTMMTTVRKHPGETQIIRYTKCIPQA